MLRKLSTWFFICVVSMGMLGCAGQQIDEDDQSWIREVEIKFVNDTTTVEKESFYRVNNLEFIAEYEYYLVRCRILSGEAVEEFIERLESDPRVEYIKPYEW